jgi:hypothetical protein
MMDLDELFRRREPRWRRAYMWDPAPEPAVDPVAAGLDGRALRMPAALERFDAPPVFICGCARSGTTWTLDLFDRHPEVRAICESWIFSQTRGVTGLLGQPYWSLAEQEGWGERVDMAFGAVQVLPYEQMVGDLASLLGGWLAQSAGEQHRFLVAKEPLDVPATATLFPEARFIHVIRDGRDVALSMRRASESWDPTMGVGLPIEFRAEAWRRQVKRLRAHRELLGERYLELRYEELKADPVRAMRTLFDFSGIPYDHALLEAIRRDTELSSYDELARRTGFRGGSREGGWRERFSARDRVRFSRAAGDLLVELGYEDGRRWLVPGLSGGVRRRSPVAGTA